MEFRAEARPPRRSSYPHRSPTRKARTPGKALTGHRQDGGDGPGYRERSSPPAIRASATPSPFPGCASSAFRGSSTWRRARASVALRRRGARRWAGASLSRTRVAAAPRSHDRPRRGAEGPARDLGRWPLDDGDDPGLRACGSRRVAAWRPAPARPRRPRAGRRGRCRRCAHRRAARAFRGQRFRVMRRLWSAVFHAQRLLRPLMSAGEILAGHLVRTRAWGARRRCVRRLSSSPSLHESPRPSTTRTMTRPNDRPLGLQHRPCRSMNRANLVVLDTGR